MKPLIQLIYNSAATCTFSDHDLELLLRGARANNANLGVTGMLLYVDGCFFQVLEGPQDVVDQLSEKIKLDSRHSKMTVIIREPISQRSFSDWSMGFTCMSAREAQRIEGLNDFFADGQILTQIDGGRAKKLLKAFGESRWRVRLATPMIRQPEAVLYAAGQQPQGADFVVKPARNFSFAFQPILNAVTRKVIGYEALLRGLRQEPAARVLQRVPLDQIAAFDEEACRSAIEAAATMQVQSNLHLNILPMMQGGTPKVFETILRTLEETGFPASRVVLELKHETTVSDPVALASWLKIYRQHGLRISIDDFGSGHAGLASALMTSVPVTPA